MSPLAISTGWPGYDRNPLPEDRSPLVHYQEYQGTRDVAAFLTVPAAIEYQASHDWDAQRERCHQLAMETQRRVFVRSLVWNHSVPIVANSLGSWWPCLYPMGKSLH